MVARAPLCKALLGTVAVVTVFSQRLETDGPSSHPRKPNIFPGSFVQKPALVNREYKSFPKRCARLTETCRHEEKPRREGAQQDSGKQDASPGVPNRARSPRSRRSDELGENSAG